MLFLIFFFSVHQAHFEDNPLDLEFLRHDKPLHPTRIQPHMKHVPKYLLPRIAPVSVGGGGGGDNNAGYDDEANKQEGFVPFKKRDSARGRGRGRGRGGRGRNSGGRGGKKKSDPLKKFGK